MLQEKLEKEIEDEDDELEIIVDEEDLGVDLEAELVRYMNDNSDEIELKPSPKP